MRRTLLLLSFVVGITGVTFGFTNDIIATLSVLAWAFAVYMVIKIILVCRQVPHAEIYQPPRIRTPKVITRKSLPKLEDEALRDEERRVGDLVKVIIAKIGSAADESAIQSFLGAKVSNLRLHTVSRYADVRGEINVIGFEGIIGTLIGLITFMAQASVLFEIPDITQDASTTEFVSTMIQNLNKIDLITVSTAFLTSIIGWGAKAWIGQWIEQRMNAELASINETEGWVQDNILAPLNLPSQVESIVELANLPALHEPLQRAVEQLETVSGQMQDGVTASKDAIEGVQALVSGITTELGPELGRVVEHLMAIGNLAFNVRYVQGGVQLIPRVDTARTQEVPRG